MMGTADQKPVAIESEELVPDEHATGKQDRLIDLESMNGLDGVWKPEMHPHLDGCQKGQDG